MIIIYLEKTLSLGSRCQHNYAEIVHQSKFIIIAKSRPSIFLNLSLRNEFDIYQWKKEFGQHSIAILESKCIIRAENTITLLCEIQ